MRSTAVILTTLMVLCSAAPVAARQSVSENMAACSALMDVSGIHIRSTDRKKRVERAGLVWADAAAKQADKEGWIAGDVTAAYASKREEWEALGPGFVSTQEFRDWTSYCRALALRFGVEVP